jgi:hypothetical protein
MPFRLLAPRHRRITLLRARGGGRAVKLLCLLLCVLHYLIRGLGLGLGDGDGGLGMGMGDWDWDWDGDWGCIHTLPTTTRPTGQLASRQPTGLR